MAAQQSISSERRMEHGTAHTKVADRPAAGRSGPAAPPPGGLGGPAAPLLGDRPPRTSAQFSPQNFFHKSPCRPAAGRPGPGRPAAGRPGVYSCKLPNRKYIFIKNKNIKYKNKKTAHARIPLHPNMPDYHMHTHDLLQ